MQSYVIKVENKEEHPNYVYELQLKRNRTVVSYTMDRDQALIVSEGSDEYEFLQKRFQKTCTFIAI